MPNNGGLVVESRFTPQAIVIVRVQLTTMGGQCLSGEKVPFAALASMLMNLQLVRS
jgi:hypothetical protein